MLNFKIERNTNQFLEKCGGKYNYTYKGKEYEITKENLTTMDPGLQQSFGHFTARKNPPPPKLSFIPIIRPIIGQNYLPPVIKARGYNMVEKVRKELIRLAKTEIRVDGPIDVQKAFKALLSEPHTAFDYRKQVVEEEINLTIFVDINTRYHIDGYMPGVDALLHNTIIEAARGVKGIRVFSASALYHIPYKGQVYEYYTDVYRDLPKKHKKRVIAFSQGCGGIGHYEGIPKGALHFVTGFTKGKTCGCGQIAKARDAGQHVHQGVVNLDSLKKLEL